MGGQRERDELGFLFDLVVAALVIAGLVALLIWGPAA